MRNSDTHDATDPSASDQRGPMFGFAGGLMAAGSAIAFGTLGVLARLSYSVGLDVRQLLALRFLFAAAAMFLLAVLVGQRPSQLRRRTVLTLVGMGGVLYAGPSLLY